MDLFYFKIDNFLIIIFNLKRDDYESLWCFFRSQRIKEGNKILLGFEIKVLFYGKLLSKIIVQ